MGDKVNDGDTYGDYMVMAEMAAHQAEALREPVALRWHSAASRRRYIRAASRARLRPARPMPSSSSVGQP